MIRRDYILRQLEQFAAMIARLTGLAKNDQWQPASAIAAGELQRLTGVEPAALLRMSASTMLARLIENEPDLSMETKTVMLATLLKSHGDLLSGQGALDDGREFYLRGLHLLLETFEPEAASNRPAFIPTVDAFRAALADVSLPPATSLTLMRHYERIGEFAKAEDSLFELLEAEPSNVEIRELGRQFYERLLRLTDDTLAAGNLPRAEVQSGLAELNARVPPEEY